LSSAGLTDAAAVFGRPPGNPFLRYRELLHGYQAALAAGLDDDGWRVLVEGLDGAVAEVDGAGFGSTPFGTNAALAAELGVASLWIKDESGNVSGSHKARHLMGVMLWLEAAGRLGLVPAGDERPLAIASCGNAALAAAVVARAARRPLEVFVPPHANRSVLERLTGLGAHLNPCPRQAGEAGDPCYLRFREALADGALPFTCQGNENGLTIDGAKTLAWEMVSDLAAADSAIDVLLLHVGGGALAAAVIDALREAHEIGVLARLPRCHAVQTRGAAPLLRAWERLSGRILVARERAWGEPSPTGEAPRAALLASPELAGRVAASLDHAATHRSEFMWPWEEEPHSIADGILDDETYDWLAILEGLLATGGWPLAAAEETLVEANDLARAATGLHPCHTGTAGLAGAMELARRGVLRPGDRVAVILSGVARGG
jgi:threonine synthase